MPTRAGPEFDQFETDGYALVGVSGPALAVASSEQVISDRAQGLPVYVMQWWQRYPSAISPAKAVSIKAPIHGLAAPSACPASSGPAMWGPGGARRRSTTLIANDIGFNQVRSLVSQAIVVV